jgi:hypothetical protein
MVRLVLVNAPQDKESELLHQLRKMDRTLVFQVHVMPADEESVQISFKVKNKHVQAILDELNAIGCGTDYGTVDVLTVLLSRPSVSLLGQSLDNQPKQRKYLITEKISFEEIKEFIESANHLTFNYIALLVCASVIAGVTLVTNNATNIIACMLVSPLMGPIRSIMLGLAIGDARMAKRGIRNEFIGVVLPFVIGVLMGIPCAFIYPSDYRSFQMVYRGKCKQFYLFFFFRFNSLVFIFLSSIKQIRICFQMF